MDKRDVVELTEAEIAAVAGGKTTEGQTGIRGKTTEGQTGIRGKTTEGQTGIRG